jgi:hypothetical protein
VTDDDVVIGFYSFVWIVNIEEYSVFLKVKKCPVLLNGSKMESMIS